MTPARRTRLFWLVCLPVRTLIAYVGVPRPIAALVSARWLLVDGPPVGFFGGVAWWAEERRAHGVLWGLYALCNDSRWLWADVVFGAANGLYEAQRIS